MATGYVSWAADLAGADGGGSIRQRERESGGQGKNRRRKGLEHIRRNEGF